MLCIAIIDSYFASKLLFLSVHPSISSVQMPFMMREDVAAKFLFGERSRVVGDGLTG